MDAKEFKDKAEALFNGPCKALVDKLDPDKFPPNWEEFIQTMTAMHTLMGAFIQLCEQARLADVDINILNETDGPR